MKRKELTKTFSDYFKLQINLSSLALYKTKYFSALKINLTQLNVSLNVWLYPIRTVLQTSHD